MGVSSSRLNRTLQKGRAPYTGSYPAQRSSRSASVLSSRPSLPPFERLTADVPPAAQNDLAQFIVAQAVEG